MKTSEYVTLGHPDKVADFISEYILDRMLEQDPYTRYALEVQIKTVEEAVLSGKKHLVTHVTLSGEVTTNAVIDYYDAVASAIRVIGYTDEYSDEWGENTINPRYISVQKHISQQSNNIAQGVNKQGWGDQGIFYGMAVKNSKTDFMPEDYYYAKKLGDILYESRIGGLDIKTQVVMKDNKVKKVIVAIPTKKNINKKIKEIVKKVIPGKYSIIINGTGTYEKHASVADAGTTGRKLAVDFYGGNCNVGGGSPWTKDGTKADLTLNLLARDMAKKYVEQGEYKEVKAGIACCIGKPDLDITVTADGEIIEERTIKVYPEELIEHYQLRTPTFAARCKYGLFWDI